jgi:hypothetical protein
MKTSDNYAIYTELHLYVWYIVGFRISSWAFWYLTRPLLKSDFWDIRLRFLWSLSRISRKPLLRSGQERYQNAQLDVLNPMIYYTYMFRFGINCIIITWTQSNLLWNCMKSLPNRPLFPFGNVRKNQLPANLKIWKIYFILIRIKAIIYLNFKSFWPREPSSVLKGLMFYYFNCICYFILFCVQ